MHSATDVSSKSFTGSRRKLAKPTALLAAFVLSIGGVFLGQTVAAPQASAASIQGRLTGSEYGWRYLNSKDTASGDPITLRKTDNTQSPVVPFLPIDGDHLYYSTVADTQVGFYEPDPAGNFTAANQRPIGFATNAQRLTGAEQLSTMAIDANPLNADRSKAVYFWPWDREIVITRAENGSQAAVCWSRPLCCGKGWPIM